jgi:hypothetical protein
MQTTTNTSPAAYPRNESVECDVPSPAVHSVMHNINVKYANKLDIAKHTIGDAYVYEWLFPPVRYVDSPMHRKKANKAKSIWWILANMGVYGGLFVAVFIDPPAPLVIARIALAFILSVIFPCVSFMVDRRVSLLKLPLLYAWFGYIGCLVVFLFIANIVNESPYNYAQMGGDVILLFYITCNAYVVYKLIGIHTVFQIGASQVQVEESQPIFDETITPIELAPPMKKSGWRNIVVYVEQLVNFSFALYLVIDIQYAQTGLVDIYYVISAICALLFSIVFIGKRVMLDREIATGVHRDWINILDAPLLFLYPIFIVMRTIQFVRDSVDVSPVVFAHTLIFALGLFTYVEENLMLIEHQSFQQKYASSSCNSS